MTIKITYFYILNTKLRLGENPDSNVCKPKLYLLTFINIFGVLRQMANNLHAKCKTFSDLQKTILSKLLYKLRF